MGEESSVDEIALVARLHGGLFIASPAPAILVENHPALEQFGGGPSAVVHPERRAHRRQRGDGDQDPHLGGSIPFGYRLGDDGELVPHEPEQEAIREMVAMKAQRLSLRAIAAELQAKGHQISHVGVQGALRARRTA